MLVLSSSARRMRTLSVYNGSRYNGVSKNSQHFSPPTSKSYYIIVLPFFYVFCKWCLTLLARSLCKHWVGASAAMYDDFEVGGENELGVFRHTLAVP